MQPVSNSHRNGIDGLRSISILAVLVFHFFPQLGGAGYLGVDVFFTISGFVISASLMNYATAKNFPAFASRFFMRRIKRLLPALLFVVLVMSVLVLLVTSHSYTTLKTGVFSLAGLANIYLYNVSLDYFGVMAELNAFTHLWSLSVEDQFYLLFPLLVWLFGNKTQPIINGRRLFVPVLALTLVSFVAWLWFLATDYDFAFYMMPTRFWQIGIGVIAWIAAESFGFSVAKQYLLPLVIAMLGVIVFGDYFVPGANAVVVVLAALILISIWQSDQKLPLFGSAVFVYIGRISYSLYIWHWPFIAIAKQTFGVSFITMLGCIVLTCVFAMFSYHYVEQPFRKGLALPGDDKITRVMVVTVISLVVFLAIFNKQSSRFSTHYNNVLAQAFGIAPVDVQYKNKCQGDDQAKKQKDPLVFCLGEKRNGSPTKKLFLVGDSHANQMGPLFEKFALQNGFSFQFSNIGRDQYGFVPMTKKPGLVTKDYQYIIEDAQPGDLLVIAFHRGRLNEILDQHLRLGTKVQPNEATENLIVNFTHIFKVLDAKGVHILLLLDTPLMNAVTTSETCALQRKLFGKNICEVTKAQDLHTRWRQERVFYAVQKAVPRIYIWDPALVIYKERDSFDVVDDQNNYLMYDWNHISRTTLQKLEPSLLQLLDSVVKEKQGGNSSALPAR